MTLDDAMKACRKQMDKSVDYLRRELRGIRTGRATTALIDYVSVPYYGNQTDLRELAAISVPEPTQLLVKPFDPGARAEIVKALESADLGLNPQVDGGTIRINIPSPSRERRQKLMNQVKKMAEEAKVSIRNERRDANKHIDQQVKDKTLHISEDAGKAAKDDVEKLTKKHTAEIEDLCKSKLAEIEDT